MDFSHNIYVNLDCIYHISNFLIIKDKIKLALSCKDYFNILKLRIERDMKISKIITRWKKITFMKNDFTKLYNKLDNFSNYNIKLSEYIDKYHKYVFYTDQKMNDNICYITGYADILYCIIIDASNLEFIKIRIQNKLFCLLMFNNCNIKGKIYLPIPIILLNDLTFFTTLKIIFNKNVKINYICLGSLMLDGNMKMKLCRK